MRETPGGRPVGAASKPKGYIEGLRLRYSSATAVAVETGSCRDSADAADMTLAAEVTPAITTINAIQGLDEQTAVATATTHGTATFEPSASLFVETFMSGTVRTLTGTTSTVGTAATGTGTKFLTETSVGDVFRSATKGASRVTSIASDTALTLAAALPGGDCTAEAATLYENLVVRIASETPQRVNTITHAGTSVVVPSAWTSNASGVAIKIGGEIATAWYAVLFVSGGSGAGAILSTQRTKPYGVTGYTTSWRRIGWVRNDDAGNFAAFDQKWSGADRLIMYEEAPASSDLDNRLVSAGGVSGATWTAVVASGVAPPTSRLGWVNLIVVGNTGGSNYIQVRERNQGSSGTRPQHVPAVSNGYTAGTVWGPLDGAQAFDWRSSNNDAAGPFYIDFVGYVDSL